MDITFFRIVLVISGVVLIAAIYFWGWAENRVQKQTKAMLRQRRMEEDDEIEPFLIKPDGRSSASFELPVIIGERGGPVETEQTQEASREASETGDGVQDVIQLSVVAGKGEKFRGCELDTSLVNLGLKFGEMGIYHSQSGPDDIDCFNVANRVEPGSFPADKLELFSTPGVVFFMQPAKQNDPLSVFDQMLETCQKLAETLGGTLLDGNQTRLEEVVISSIRKSLLIQ